MISSYLMSLQKIQEEVDQPDIVVVGLIERNIHDYRTADMIEVAVHEIVEHEFQDLELAMRYLTVGSTVGYTNQNSCHPRSRE
jgi:hypothetical protein